MADLSSVFLLLLPVAAASGWYAAHRSVKRGGNSSSRDFNSEYFKGLNYLLNEQQDKAIEVFLHMTKIDGETVETHFALGNLFRRRGEVDRAIRVHQNLVTRDNLTDEQHSQALLALAEDYMRAGLLDRAENLFKEIIQLPGKHPHALRHLIDIYEQEKDWVSAIEATRELSHQTEANFAGVVAQYFCELAEQKQEQGDYSAVMRHLERALSMDPCCVRASLMLAKVHESNGEYEKAIPVYQQVEEQDIEYVPEIIENLLFCYNKLDKLYQVMPYLESLVAKSDGLSPMLAYADLLWRRDGDDAARQYIIEQLRRRPSVRGLDKLIDVHLSDCDESSREGWMILRHLTQELIEDKPLYSCVNCGFKGKSLHWQCPGCKTWHTVKPVHGITGE